MTRKLIDLADIYRDAGLTVFEHTGKDRVTGQQIPWQEFGRRRRSEYNVDYFDGGPTHIMEHHTATGPNVSTESLVNYSNQNYEYRPLVNTIFPRDGSVHVLSAGPANTNGSGHDSWGGGVPDNAMNDWAIGHEIANDGSGEPYPEAQQESVFIATVAECREYSIPSHNVRSHFEWAPGRKIDPYGPCRWNNNQNTFWNMEALRQDVLLALSAGPGPLPPPSGDDMEILPSPIRLFDSRWWGTTPVPAGAHEFETPANVPASKALSITVTAVDPAADGFATVWSGVGLKPDASCLNYQRGQNIANTTQVGVADRKFKMFLNQASHLVIDVVGYV